MSKILIQNSRFVIALHAENGVAVRCLCCSTDVEFEGEGSIKEYESSAWASRGFCSSCGTHLFSRFKKTGSYNMPVGLFPTTVGLKMTMQYFSDLKPDYYCFSSDTAEMTEAEIYAHFASQL